MTARELVLAAHPKARCWQSPSRDGYKVYALVGGCPTGISATCETEKAAWESAAEWVRSRDSAKDAADV